MFSEFKDNLDKPLSLLNNVNAMSKQRLGSKCTPMHFRATKFDHGKHIPAHKQNHDIASERKHNLAI